MWCDGDFPRASVVVVVKIAETSQKNRNVFCSREDFDVTTTSPFWYIPYFDVSFVVCVSARKA